jgi:hypothetical protein
MRHRRRTGLRPTAYLLRPDSQPPAHVAEILRDSTKKAQPMRGGINSWLRRVSGNSGREPTGSLVRESTVWWRNAGPDP